MLGGLLSAYHLSGGDSLYLKKATELADRMLPAFDTPSGLPLPVINLALREGLYTTNLPGLSSIAEVATLQLEFRYLSHLTDDDKYWRAVEKVRSLTTLSYSFDMRFVGDGGSEKGSIASRFSFSFLEVCINQFDHRYIAFLII